MLYPKIYRPNKLRQQIKLVPPYLRQIWIYCLIVNYLLIFVCQHGAMSELTSKSIPVGIYAGNPNGSDPAAEALFEKYYSQFAQTLGINPQFITAFIDHQQPIDQWINNASWQAWSNRNSPVASQLTPVISLPMASLAAGSPTQDQFYKNFASGAYDETLRSMVKAWSDQGFKQQYWRPGWEMNLESSPSYAGSDPATQADWISAFQHISSVLHEAAIQNGVDLQVIWNPSTSNYSNAGVATKTLYPGNNYVDIIGADVYADISPYGSPNAIYDWAKNDGSTTSDLQQWASDPANLKHYWTYPAATQWAVDSSQGHSLSLQDLIDFARAQGKPLAIPETGAGSTNDGAGVKDNPAFVEWLASTLANSGVTVPFVNIWDSNGGANYKFSAPEDGKPLEAAAWGRYFGNVASTLTLGAGPNRLALAVTEDAWKGDAQFVVSVDGQQIGGVLSATALHRSGVSQLINIDGDFGPGSHTLGVTFLNDLYGGSADTDRNLYIDGLALDGQPVAHASRTLLSSGQQSIDFHMAPSVPITLGSGADTLALTIAEDAWNGDARFTVKVDGVQVGGTETASALRNMGEMQTVNVNGDFARGSHNLTVDFLNDGYGGSSDTDRNLFVTGATINGVAVEGARLDMLGQGPASFSFVAPGPATDMLKLRVSEDRWLDDAKFTVQIDGTTLPGVHTVTSLHAAGKSEEVAIGGTWGSGAHTIGISFINDASGGTADTDRNLYIDAISYNGRNLTGAPASLLGTETRNFVVPASAAPTTIKLLLAEDAWQGDAKYALAIDGSPVGPVGTVTTARSSGSSQAVTLEATLTSGAHDVAVSFLNDRYGGSPGMDRNLYVNGIEVNGLPSANAAAAMYSNQTNHFTIIVP